MRLSGPQSAAIARVSHRAEGRTEFLGAPPSANCVDDEGHIVDEVIVTYFAAPRSYTAEDVIEISCHGAPVVLRHCLDRAVARGRPTRRTGRVHAARLPERPHRSAAGRSRPRPHRSHHALSGAHRGAADARFRLPPARSRQGATARTDRAARSRHRFRRRRYQRRAGLRNPSPARPDHQQTGALARSFRYGNLVRSGFSLAIVGPPNAGKSSLFNRLLRTGPRHRHGNSRHNARRGFGNGGVCRNSRAPCRYGGNPRNA